MEFKPKLMHRLRAFKIFEISDGIKIGVFQGSRGVKPELDILIKYIQPGKRLRTPQHLHWAIDLIIKKEHNPKLTKQFIEYLQNMWDDVAPFKTKQDQKDCKLRFSQEVRVKPFKPLNRYGEYSVEFIATLIELLMIQEKTGAHKAFMFKGVLDAIHDDKDIFSIVSSAGYRGG